MITKHAQILKKAPSWLYKAGAQLWKDEVYPRHLFLETTSNCNLRCPYCPREQIQDDMDFRLLQKVVEEATQYGPRSFSLHLFGEPLLYPHIAKAIRYVKAKHKKHTVLLTTNGTELNRQAGEILAAGVDKIIWSWRPEAKFTPATLSLLRASGKFYPRLIDGVVPQRAWEQWKQWPQVEVRRLHNYGGNIDTSRWKSKSGVRPASGSRVDLKSPSQDRWPCYHLWLAPGVSWDGNLLLCCADPHQKEKLGSITQTTLANLWQGRDLAKKRQEQMAGEYTGICEKCDVWKDYPDIWYSWQKNQA